MSFGNPFDEEPIDFDTMQLILLRILQFLVFALALLILAEVSYAPV